MKPVQCQVIIPRQVFTVRFFNSIEATAKATESAPAPAKPSYGGLGGRSSLLQRRLQAGSIQHFDSGEHFRLQAEKTRQEHDQRA